MREKYKYKIELYENRAIVTKYEESKYRYRENHGEQNIQRVRTEEELLRERERATNHQMYAIKRKIKQYCIANEFDMFWTLTFDDKKIDSTDYQKARQRVQKWLRNLRDRYGKFDYIFIPEYHKSGRIHFHGVTKGCKSKIIEAKNNKTGKRIRQKGKIIFNCPDWKFGYSTVSVIENSEKTASYITKYITKELTKMPHGYRQSKYIVSRGLKKPEIIYFNDELDLFNFSPSLVIGEMEKNGTFKKKLSIYQLQRTEDDDFVQDNSVETRIITKSKVKNEKEKNIKDDPET
ncbi:rolling circle replication-associated protein [Streptococcus hyointestinalis]|nr:hypothetical protein [Streptococcus hyointestinalis]